MGKFSNWILFPGTAAPKIREGIRNLGFALASELENFVSYGVPQYLTSDQKARARSNIDAQAFDAALQSIAGLTTSANQMLYTTGADTYATTALTAFARTLLDDANAAAMRATLGLAAIAASGNASDITAGTISDDRLPNPMSEKTFLERIFISGASPAVNFFRTATNRWRHIIDPSSGSLVIQHSNDGFVSNFVNALALTTAGGLSSLGQQVWDAGNQLALGTTPASARTAIQLQNVNNTSDANKPVSTAQQTALDLKANLASPAFSGSPTAPTPGGGDNSTKLATTAFVAAAVSGVTSALTKYYDSGALAITSAGLLTLTHGLASRPKVVVATLTFVTATQGYAVGDEIGITPNPDIGASATYGVAIRRTNSQLLVRFSSATNCFVILNGSTGAGIEIPNSAVTLRVEAFA